MTRSRRSLSLLATASVLLAAILVTTAPVTTSSATAAAPLPEITGHNIVDETVSEGPSGGWKRIRLAFVRHGDLSKPSSVRFTLVDGTATRGSDYTAASYAKTLWFRADTAAVYVDLNVKGDALVEPDETFSWHLSDPTGATIRDGYADGVITIINDDSAAPSTFSVEDGDTTVTGEKSNIAANALIRVTRSGSTASLARVTITTSDGTARAPGDYAARRTVLYFGVGEAAEVLRVPIKNDLVPEPTETFTVQLSAPVNATIVDGTAVGTILDNDSSEPPQLRWQEVCSSESSGQTSSGLAIIREGDLRVTSTVTWATSDGTAHAPGDYRAKTGTVTFWRGEKYKWVSVSVKDDLEPEPTEHFFVTMSDPSPGTTLSDPVGQVCIYANDGG